MFNLGMPEMLFTKVERDFGPGYQAEVRTPDPGVVRGSGGADVVIRTGLDAVDRADTVLVVGNGAEEVPDPRVLDAVRRAAADGKRVASICTGAFVLAEAGLLDGRRATTYWAYTRELAARYPKVLLEPDVLYVQDGQLLTSSGSAAGNDLCLHIIHTATGPRSPTRSRGRRWWRPYGRAARPSSPTPRCRPRPALRSPRPVPG